MMTYKLGGEYRLYVIRTLSLSAVYIYKISENWQSLQEQLILKSSVHTNVIKVKEFKNGMDFYYAAKQDARKLVDFIVGVVPCR